MEGLTKENTIQSLYTVPLKNVVFFPYTTATILVGREKSINSIQKSIESQTQIFVVTQKKSDIENVSIKNLFSVGVVCNIIEKTVTTDGILKVIIEGMFKARICKMIPSTDHFLSKIEKEDDDVNKNIDLSTKKECIDLFKKYSKFNKKITNDIKNSISHTSSPVKISNVIASFLNCNTQSKQEVLEEKDVSLRFHKISKLIRIELSIFEMEAEISKNIQEKISRSQKELYLNEQLKYIKKELGQGEENEIDKIKRKISTLKLPKEVDSKCKSELSKLEKTNTFSSEAGVIRSYLDWIISIPWSKQTTFNKNLNKAESTLNKNHYALTKIKDRILEFIAVQIKTNQLKGPILCLVGPPGVGKTSLAKSIADTLNRKYVKVSLGGVRDESEIRGHRRTYIGSLPGKIIQSMKKVGVINPLMLLDEIDKISYDIRGNPASALLEVLDPEQNKHFNDHYLEVDYDLSKVMFVATANDISQISPPLRDRMEIIKLSSYTENEKLQIAKKYLLKTQRKEHGLSATELEISDKALLEIIRKYTFEAGVRNLNREIAKISRKIVKETINQDLKSPKITEKNIKKYIGPEKFNYGIAKKENKVGIATGLAYTSFGGDLLDIEAVKFKGSGKIQITGKLGDVMQESAKTSLSYVRSISKKLKISNKEFNSYDFHIHVPEGATPKDGPSAGIALCISLASCISKLKVNKDIATTGEVTLTGKVLKIGGLKEKLLAALRGGIKKVIIPKDNNNDLEELPKEVLENIEIKTVSSVEEALWEVLIKEKNNATRQ